jgi:hypothetical protein
VERCASWVKAVCAEEVVCGRGFFDYLLSFLAFLLILQRRGYSIPPRRFNDNESFISAACGFLVSIVKDVEI